MSTAAVITAVILGLLVMVVLVLIAERRSGR